MSTPELYARFPHLLRRFRCNELKNFCRRKGYRLVRYYQPGRGRGPFRGSWRLRIERLPWPGAAGRMKQHEYCNTEVATAAQRLFIHLYKQPDASSRRRRPE